MDETPARTEELPELLRQARALLDRYQRVRADEILAPALPRAGGASERLLHDLHLLACEAAFLRNDYPRAQRHAEQALELARSLGQGTLEALALGWTGAALAQQDRYTEAQARLKSAIDRLRALGQEPLACRALNYLAVVQRELGDVQEAIATWERAVAMARRAGDLDVLGRGLSNLGEAWGLVRQPEKAEALLREALAVVEPRGDQASTARARLALARLALDAGRDDQALELSQSALEPAEQSGADRTLAEVLRALGTLRARRGERDEALRLLGSALAAFEKLGIQREVFRTHLALSEAHERLGDFAAALRHHQLYARLRAELADEVARAQVAAQAARHELEKGRSQQEIERLRNVELAEANARLAHQAQELQELSRRDPLTGLVNRRALGERLAEEFDRSRRYGSALSVAMADVDLLRQVNSTWSEAAGDEILRGVADLFVSLLRKVDVVARYGGAEFAILFPETAHAQALIACEKLRAAVEASQWEVVAPGLKVTVSLGVASGIDYASWERLLSAAGTRLGEAKRLGRNRVCG